MSNLSVKSIFSQLNLMIAEVSIIFNDPLKFDLMASKFEAVSE